MLPRPIATRPQATKIKRIRPRKAASTSASRPEVAAGGVYGVGAPKYLAAGWQSPLPLSRGQKEGGLPLDRTGRGKPYATEAEVAQWCAQRSNDNLALRMPSNVAVDGQLYDVVGVDVDDYISGGKRKRGAAQLRKLEQEYGPLPATYSSGNRGVDKPSRIRFFLVPPGLHWRGKADKDVDIISPGYRYAMVWPSKHPEGRDYVWADPNGEQLSAGEIPNPASLAVLPEAWVELLTNGRMPDEGTEADLDSSVEDILEWARGLPGYSDEPCDTMQGKGIDYAIRQIDEDASSHDKITSAHWGLIMLALEGHSGLGKAVDAVERHWVEDVKARGKRSLDEFRREVFRSGVNALRKLKGQVESGQLRLVQDDECQEPEQLAALADLEAWTAAIKHESSRVIFKTLTSAQWAETVPPVRWMIKGTLCEDTFGPNAGPKKSLKTHDNQAIAFACATAQPLYLYSDFAVATARKVLYIVGEGGELPVRRTLQRMARAYGLSLDHVAGDPDFPLVVAFGAAPMDADPFVDELKGLLDSHQPELVLIESFYNFHPRDLETGNLYQRGQAIDEFHKLVRGQCVGATSILTDHFRSTGVGKSIDLDNISMAGQAENADSWILRNHREVPDVVEGEFRLRTEFNSRQWGGGAWDVDWHLGRFDPELGGHDGEISWDVQPATDTANGGKARGPSNTERANLILEYVDAHPEASQTAVVDALCHEHGGRNSFRAEFTKLLDARLLVEAPFVRKVPRSDGTTRPRPAVGFVRGDGKVKVSLGDVSDADDE